VTFFVAGVITQPPQGAVRLMAVINPPGPNHIPESDETNGIDVNNVEVVPLLVTITTPDTHQVGQVANPQSAYIGVEGVDLGSPNSKVEVETRTSTGIVISSTVVGTDTSGLWDAVVLGTSSAYTVRAFDIADPAVFDSVFVHCQDKNGNKELVYYWELQKGDLILSTSNDTTEHTLYGAGYSQVSIYVGPDANGTPMVTEAVPSLSATPIHWTGYVQTVPLDMSEAYVG
jgi:hypothetical protein